MKSIKKMTSEVIDIVHENTEADPEEWVDDDGKSGCDLNLSPSQECYEKLNAYFSNIYVEIMIDILKNYYNQPKSKISGR